MNQAKIKSANPFIIGPAIEAWWMTLELLNRIARNPLYWLAMIAIALAAEGVALYYQYALNQYPCVLCIHVRIWVAAFVVVGILGLFLRRGMTSLRIANVLSVIAAVGFTERSWRTLATERGWIVELACPMNAGLPAWFDLETWFPSVFAVQASCGVSPELMFGITMAEGLLVMSLGTLVVTTLVLVASLVRDN